MINKSKKLKGIKIVTIFICVLGLTIVVNTKGESSQINADEISTRSLTITIDSTTFPDATFRTYILSELGGLPNGSVVTDMQLATITDIDVISQPISSLAGIEYLTNLQTVNFSNTMVSSVDLSNNILLKEVVCYNTLLTDIDVQSNLNLEMLDISRNSITSLDVSNNLNLKVLYCYQNPISIIDVTNNIYLEELNCSQTGISEIDLTSNVSLNYLSLYNNNLTELDVTQNTLLTFLHCHDNQIKTLDLSQNLFLTTLYCHNNNLAVLDISHLTGLLSANTSIANQNAELLVYYEDNIWKMDAQDIVGVSNITNFMPTGTDLDYDNVTGIGIFTTFTDETTKPSAVAYDYQVVYNAGNIELMDVTTTTVEKIIPPVTGPTPPTVVVPGVTTPKEPEKSVTEKDRGKETSKDPIINKQQSSFVINGNSISNMINKLELSKMYNISLVAEDIFSNNKEIDDLEKIYVHTSTKLKTGTNNSLYDTNMIIGVLSSIAGIIILSISIKRKNR